MSRKSLLRAMMLTLAAASASAASAQEWWNPMSWGSPRPYSGYMVRYGGSSSSCANGVCRPSYGTGSYYGKGNPGWSGYRPPVYQPNDRRDHSDRYGDWEAAYRPAPQPIRSRSNPFYE